MPKRENGQNDHLCGINGLGHKILVNFTKNGSFVAKKVIRNFAIFEIFHIY